MRLFYGEFYFEGRDTHLSFAIVCKGKKEAREAAMEAKKKSVFRNREIKHERWRSKKVPGQVDNWGRTTIITEVV